VQAAFHILLKTFQPRLQLCFRPHFNWRFAQEVTSFQSAKSPQVRDFWDSQLGSPSTKWHLGATSIVNHTNTIRGKMLASSKFELWWALWIHVCSWFVHAPKVTNYALTNLFGLCRYLWIIDPLVICPSPHPRTLACLLTSEMLRVKECTLTPYFIIVFTFRLTFESLKEFGGATMS
jgi:hypothetical protein